MKKATDLESRMDNAFEQAKREETLATKYQSAEFKKEYKRKWKEINKKSKQFLKKKKVI